MTFVRTVCDRLEFSLVNQLRQILAVMIDLITATVLRILILECVEAMGTGSDYFLDVVLVRGSQRSLWPGSRIETRYRCVAQDRRNISRPVP